MAKGQYPQQPMVPPGSQEQQKSEDYRLLGGINQKVNLYSNGPAEFRDISNLNFIQAGALCGRPGTTLFAGSTQYYYNPITLGQSLAFQLGVTIGYTAGITLGLGVVTSGYEFAKLDGSSYLILASSSPTLAGASNQMVLLAAQAGGFTAVYGYSTSALAAAGPYGSIWSFSPFVDRLFACNGNNFYRISPYQSSDTGPLNAFNYSLPSASVFPGGWTFANSSLLYTGNTLTGVITGVSSAGGWTGTYVLGYAFINDRGFVGPPSNGITMSFAGGTGPQFQISGMTRLQYSYGVTAIQFYQSAPGGVVLTAMATLIPASQAVGDTLTFAPLYASLSVVAPVANSYFDFSNSWAALGAGSGWNYPRYTEVFNNQLFMAGFSTAPSTFWWSDIGEPEGVQPNFSVQVRTNDGDRITGLKAYFGSLVITKQRSVHLLSGDNPANFLLQELTDQYGCLSHKALLPWNNNLWFLDSKGVMEYNGANIRCVSDKMEPIFNAMNVQAAQDQACAVHVKQFNELWFAIPAAGSTINNMIVVYDYVAESWTHYDGINPSCLVNAFGGFPNKKPFSGGYTGGLIYFDPTLTSDNDRGITYHFDSCFFSARGQSTQNLYRRFYLDVNPVLGFTQAITLTFQKDFGTTPQVTQTMYANPFQSRIDFGISARSIQASMYCYSASLQIVVNGFTVESRYLRGV